MKSVNVQEAKTHLSRLLEEVKAGQEIVLAKAGKPIARLVPYKKSVKSRVGGQFKGQVWQAEDCWDSDDPLGDAADGPLYQMGESDLNDVMVAED